MLLLLQCKWIRGGLALRDKEGGGEGKGKGGYEPSELMGVLLSQIVFVLILDSLMMMMMLRPAAKIRRRRGTVSWRRCVACGRGYLL